MPRTRREITCPCRIRIMRSRYGRKPKRLTIAKRVIVARSRCARKKTPTESKQEAPHAEAEATNQATIGRSCTFGRSRKTSHLPRFRGCCANRFRRQLASQLLPYTSETRPRSERRRARRKRWQETAFHNGKAYTVSGHLGRLEQKRDRSEVQAATQADLLFFHLFYVYTYVYRYVQRVHSNGRDIRGMPYDFGCAASAPGAWLSALLYIEPSIL